MNYYGHMQSLKLSNYRIKDKKILDFIIIQILDPNSCISKNPEKYQGFVERIIEDYASFDLPYKLQEQYCYFTRHTLSTEYTLGVHISQEKYIMFKQSQIESLLYSKDIDIFETNFHENTHANQDFDIRSSNINSFNKYLMIKEKILRAEKEEYYSENYEDIFIEIEARQKAREKLGQFIDRLPKNLRIQSLQRLVNRKLGFEPDEKEQEFIDGRRKINVFNPSKPKEDVSIIFDEIIRQHPEYLKEYPMLQMEYNPDGSQKSLQDLVETIDSEDSKPKRAIYVALIRKGSVFKFENFESDLEFLLNYDIQRSASTPAISLIYMHMFTTLLKKMEQLSSEERQKIYPIIDKLNERLEAIEKKEKITLAEKVFRKSLRRKDRESQKPLIELLNEARQQSCDEKKKAGEEPSQSSDDNPSTSPAIPLMFEAFYSTTDAQRAQAKRELIEIARLDEHKTQESGYIEAKIY